MCVIDVVASDLISLPSAHNETLTHTHIHATHTHSGHCCRDLKTCIYNTHTLQHNPSASLNAHRLLCQNDFAHDGDDGDVVAVAVALAVDVDVVPASVAIVVVVAVAVFAVAVAVAVVAVPPAVSPWYIS